jgi:alpha-methylacyl-CoA racemase
VNVATGPLAGLRVVEFAAIGPVPFCGMLLADLGASVVRVDRLGGSRSEHAVPVLDRGRASIALDLRKSGAVEVALRLVATADALLEGYRPGVMEKIGLGPDACLARNPRLVYGRLTGWGRDGPLAQTAGHDINYIALTGALNAIGEAHRGPVPPMNMLGDFGGGAMLLAVGVLAALLEARVSGRGQVVDAAMTDGTALLMTLIYELKQLGQWNSRRGANLFDGGAPFYATYECADGGYIAVGAYEEVFYRELLERLGIAETRFASQWERSQWPALRRALADTFRTRTREEWAAHFAGSDACVTPVLDLDEAPRHPHNRARGTFAGPAAAELPAAAPRFGRTPAAASAHRCRPGDSTDQILRDVGYDESTIARLRAAGVC